MEQKIKNATLTLISEGGIKPMLRYHGEGRLAADEKGFRFVESKRRIHTRNVRIYGREKNFENSVKYLTKNGRFKLTVFLGPSEMEIFKPARDAVDELIKATWDSGWVNKRGGTK